MKRVILHIGQTKSGSSALQRFFVINREHLASKGIIYYKPHHRYHAWNNQSNADALIYYALHLLGHVTSPDVISALQEEIIALRKCSEGADTILLSDESIFISGLNIKGYWQAIKTAIEICFGKDVKTDIIIYLRRQDEWAFSEWKERMRSDLCIPEDYCTFLEMLKKNNSLNYADQLELIEEAFDKDGITVSEYGERLFGTVDIFHDFMNTVSLSWSDSYIIPEKKVNKSLTSAAAYAMCLINNEYEGQFDRRLLYHAASCFSIMYPEEPNYPLSTGERLKLIDFYMPGNKQIEERYMSGEKLFSDEILPYSIWKDDIIRDRKNAEKIIRLSTMPLKTFRLIYMSGE